MPALALRSGVDTSLRKELGEAGYANACALEQDEEISPEGVRWHAQMVEDEEFQTFLAELRAAMGECHLSQN